MTVPEANLGLRRMHIDVDLFGVAIEEQQRERIAGRRHQVVIRRRSACISSWSRISRPLTKRKIELRLGF